MSRRRRPVERILSGHKIVVNGKLLVNNYLQSNQMTSSRMFYQFHFDVFLIMSNMLPLHYWPQLWPITRMILYNNDFGNSFQEKNKLFKWGKQRECLRCFYLGYSFFITHIHILSAPCLLMCLMTGISLGFSLLLRWKLKNEKGSIILGLIRCVNKKLAEETCCLMQVTLEEKAHCKVIKPTHEL